MVMGAGCKSEGWGSKPSRVRTPMGPILTSLATFDPRLPRNEKKVIVISSQNSKVSEMINFA